MLMYADMQNQTEAQLKDTCRKLTKLEKTRDMEACLFQTTIY